MELKELTDKTLELLEINNTDEMSSRLFEVVKNNSKDKLSTIFLSILQMYKQHIIYLNDEENRYLAELRDALLPDLMSGKLSIDEILGGGE